MTETRTIAILGGTGDEGGALALRFAHAGHEVIIGSRDAARAQATAEALAARLPAARVSGATLTDAADTAEIVLMTVPHAAQEATALGVAEALRGKILIDATVPLAPPKVMRVQLPGGRSAVAQLQDKLGEDVRVVAAFQNVSASHLNDLDHEVACDVLICGNDKEAREEVAALCTTIGLRGIPAGVIDNAAATEALTSLLISINKRFKVPGAGIRITGIPES